MERRAAAAAQPRPQPIVHEATLMKRLDLLLESLKPLCVDSIEFLAYRTQGEQVLHAKGFRPARDFVVNLHSMLRARAQTDEEEDPDTV
jgi:hypothetical protein